MNRPTPPSLLALAALVLLAAAWSHARAGDDAAKAVDFAVEVPEGTVSPVYAAVSATVAGKRAWAPDGVALTADEHGVWRAHVTFSGVQSLEWKVTRGDWKTVEKAASGAEIRNRVLELTAAVTVAHARVAAWSGASESDTTGAESATTAAITTLLVDLGSWQPAKLPSARRVVACLPPGYDKPENAERRYPVLYVLDGQNQFEPARSFCGVVWRLDHAILDHVAHGHEAFIAIAIDNTPQRADEYLPWAEPKRSGGGGRLEDLASFLFDELKPKIDARFRTRPEPANTGILGSSFGGMAALHLGWKHSDVLQRCGVVSPSLWVKNEETKRVIAATRAKPPLKIWLDMGTRESKDDEGSRSAIDTARAVRDALVTVGFDEKKDLHYVEVEGGIHNEASWAERLPEILQFLFP